MGVRHCRGGGKKPEKFGVKSKNLGKNGNFQEKIEIGKYKKLLKR